MFPDPLLVCSITNILSSSFSNFLLVVYVVFQSYSTYDFLGKIF